jgi:predicted MFS family arabinose efflux permease
MGYLFATTKVLRQRAFMQALIFGAFCLFWTAAPLLLASPAFGLSQTGIAIFALVGVAGAVSAPMAGIGADRGRARIATTVSLLCGSLAFAIAYITPQARWLGVVFLATGAILIDAGVSANLVLGQRAIFALAPEQRGRLNSVYIATAFIGGASGSAIGAWSYATGGWSLTATLGFAMPAVALVFHRLRN